MASDSFTWAGKISSGAAGALGALRLLRGLEAGQVNGEVWVRGPRLRPADDETVRHVPWEERYEVAENGRLRRTGRLLTEGTFPPCSWEPLDSFLRPRLPAPMANGCLPTTVALELRPAAAASEPCLLEVERKDWIAYVDTAPRIRLQCLSFAVDELNPDRILVRGLPLPPLRGIRFVESECIAVPAGFHWHPPVAADTVRRALDMDDSELVILRENGSSSRVPRAAWNAATRTTVRLMLSPSHHA